MPKHAHKTTFKKQMKPSPQSQQSSPTITPTIDITSPDALTTPHGIMQLQRTIGNTAVQRLLKQQSPTNNVAQREPSDENATRSWKPPAAFEPDGEATIRKDGMWGVMIMNQKMGEVKRALDAEKDADMIQQLEDAITAGHTMFTNLADMEDPDGNLTADEVGQLEFFSLLIQNTYQESLSTIRSRAKRDIAPLKKGPDTEKLDSVKKDLAEKLHSAFIQGQTGTTISNIGEAFTQIEEYKKKADDVVKWAKKISDHIEFAKASELLEVIGKKSAALGEGMDKIKSVISTATALETLFGDSKTSDVHDGINRLSAGLDLIDTTMTFAKAVPLLGALWSNYYAPMTRAILKQLAVLADARDLQGRQYAQLRWATEQIHGKDNKGKAPTIPAGSESYFPGGQPIFDFMYDVMHNNKPKVTGTVETFFAERGDLFNAPIKKDSSKLETESTTLNPFDNDDKAPDLEYWVKGNKDMVWAQLYGAVPSNL